MTSVQAVNAIETPCKSKTYKKSLTCLDLYINPVFNDEGKIEFIKIYATNKKDNCGCSFYEAIADLLTFSIRRIRNHHEAVAICRSLRGHRCLGNVANEKRITSCADAIARAIMEALNVSEAEVWKRPE